MEHNHSLEKEASGTWYSLHLNAKSATDVESKKACAHFIKTLREEFFCLNCRGHFNDHCLRNPLPNIYNSGPKDFFHWTVDAHNNANRLTGKPILSYQEAESLYYDTTNNGICMSCGGAPQPTPPTSYSRFKPNSITPGPFSMAARMPNSPAPRGFNNNYHQ